MMTYKKRKRLFFVEWGYWTFLEIVLLRFEEEMAFMGDSCNRKLHLADHQREGVAFRGRAYQWKPNPYSCLGFEGKPRKTLERLCRSRR